MRFSDVPTGMPFRFPSGPTIYIARENGWFSTPTGHDGGPWHTTGDTEVEQVPTKLHSHSFDGFNESELRMLLSALYITEVTKYTSGDRALICSEFTNRGIEMPRDMFTLELPIPNLDSPTVEPITLRKFAKTLISLAAYCNIRADAVSHQRKHGMSDVSDNDKARLDMMFYGLPDWAKWRGR
jgi:hypothetical protein